MKRRHFYSILLLAACLMGKLNATAQHKTVVYGNLGTSNVNISIMNTPYGTSSDANGRYELPINDRTKTVKLYYSCIGYQDTIVNLSPKQLQKDSINISFRMQMQNYGLQEVTISASTKLYGESYYFMDFEVFDNSICILTACPNKKLHCLIMVDEDFHGIDTIPISAHIKPELVMRDCMGNCQLVGKDSVYEIDLTALPYKFLAVEKSHYFRTMSDCLFATEEYIYFKEKGMQGYYTMFYRVDLETKKPQHLFTSNMTSLIDDYYRELDFNFKYPFVYTIPGIGVPFGIYNRYVTEYWFRPSDADLLLANDTLYYFEQSLGTIQCYDLEAKLIDSCAIQYPFIEGWHHVLYQDFVQNRFFTIVKDQLLEIDPISGSTTTKTTLNPNFYSKIVIHNGQLLLLKKTHYSSGATKTFIEKRKL